MTHMIIMLIFNDFVIIKWKKINFLFSNFQYEKNDRKYSYHNFNWMHICVQTKLALN